LLPIAASVQVWRTRQTENPPLNSASINDAAVHSHRAQREEKVFVRDRDCDRVATSPTIANRGSAHPAGSAAETTGLRG